MGQAMYMGAIVGNTYQVRAPRSDELYRFPNKRWVEIRSDDEEYFESLASDVRKNEKKLWKYKADKKKPKPEKVPEAEEKTIDVMKELEEFKENVPEDELNELTAKTEEK